MYFNYYEVMLRQCVLRIMIFVLFMKHCRWILKTIPLIHNKKCFMYLHMLVSLSYIVSVPLFRAQVNRIPHSNLDLSGNLPD
jgi:hypothetical protein